MRIFKFAILGIILCFSSCTQISFSSKGKISTSIGPVPQHTELVVAEGVKEFYLFGSIPGHHEVYIDEELENVGLISAANISIHSYRSWSSFFKGILTFGIYTPMNYRIRSYGVKPIQDEYR